MALLQEQARICRELDNTPDLDTSLHNQRGIPNTQLQVSLQHEANARYERGDMDGTMALFKEQAEICRELDNREALQGSLGNQAVILYERGDLNGATELMQEQERICREIDHQRGLQKSRDNQALVLKARRRMRRPWKRK
jgi:hypothetical protein